MLFGDMLEITREWPTLNDRRYEEACYLRWLALAIMASMVDGPCLMSDYDVINQSFTPAHLGNPAPVVCHEATRVPCLMQVSGSKGANQIVEWILSRQPGNVNHYSDMIAVKEADWPITGSCIEYGTAGWQNAAAVHVATAAVRAQRPGVDKLSVMREILVDEVRSS